MAAGAIEIDLSAAIVGLRGATPLIVTTRSPEADESALPFGAFEPTRHRTLEIALRSWVDEQAGLPLGYTEQLYTFADRGRHARVGDAAPHTVSIGYLALVRPIGMAERAGPGSWANWYGYFPWEDWRGGRPAMLDDIIVTLTDWAQGAGQTGAQGSASSSDRATRALRVQAAFGTEDGWDEERTLERYELLYEAGLVAESWRDGRPAARERGSPGHLGRAMRFDHRRILATAIGRLRGKLKYRPVIFELMPPEFTLTELQTAAEAVAGRTFHKQNFRRLVDSAGLVEPTGAKRTTAERGVTQGRPAALFRFRREALGERPSLGLRLGSR